MEVSKLKELVAMYAYELDEKADRVAAEADYQNDSPLQAAFDMRHDNVITVGHVKKFVAWVEARKV